MVVLAAGCAKVMITMGVPMPRWAPYGLLGAILISMTFGAARRSEEGAMIAGLPATFAGLMLVFDHLGQPRPALGRDATLWLLLFTAVAAGVIAWIYMGYAYADYQPPPGPPAGRCQRCGAHLYRDRVNRGWCYSADYEYQCPPELRASDDRRHHLVALQPADVHASRVPDPGPGPTVRTHL